MDEHTQTDTNADSLSVRLAKWAGWQVEQVQERGYTDFLNVWSPDGRRRGLSDNGHWTDRIHQSYLDKVIPDYAGSLDAGMTLLNPTERQLQVVFRYSVYEQKSECMLLKFGNIGHDSHVKTAHGDTDDDFALALARALDALRQQQEDAR